MASIPTPRQIDIKKQDLNQKIGNLKSVYKKFITEWSSVDREEKELMSELSKHVDKKKMYDVLKTIQSLK